MDLDKLYDDTLTWMAVLRDVDSSFPRQPDTYDDEFWPWLEAKLRAHKAFPSQLVSDVYWPWLEASLRAHGAFPSKLLPGGVLARSSKGLQQSSPLGFSSISTLAILPIPEQDILQDHTTRLPTSRLDAPPPRFENPAKITKPKTVERRLGSYLNQHQLCMLRQKENQIARKLETKSISELQMLQDKASRSDASNKIKNLLQEALFKKHAAEMREWENQLDSVSENQQDKGSTRAEQQRTQELQHQTLQKNTWVPRKIFEQLEQDSPGSGSHESGAFGE